jgi:hypothetical protein
VGYCQGLDLVVAFALSVAQEAWPEDLQAAEENTFHFIIDILRFGDLRSWLEPPLKGLRVAAAGLASLFRQRCPQFAARLTSEGVRPELLCLSWLQTLFTGLTPLPRASLCRVWDCWLLDGTPKVFIRVALSLLVRVEGAVGEAPVESVVQVLKSFPEPLDTCLGHKRLIVDAWLTKITNKVLRRTLDEAETCLEQGDCQLEATLPDIAAPAPRADGVLDEIELEEAEPPQDPSTCIKAPGGVELF